MVPVVRVFLGGEEAVFRGGWLLWQPGDASGTYGEEHNTIYLYFLPLRLIAALSPSTKQRRAHLVRHISLSRPSRHREKGR